MAKNKQSQTQETKENKTSVLRSKKSKKAESKQDNKVKKSTSKPIDKTDKPKLNWKVIVLLAVIGLAGLAYIFRGLFVAAVVNGTPISRIQILRQSEQAQGTQILDNLVTEQLVLQEAQEQGVQVSEEEMQAEIEKIREQVSAQGQDLEQILAMQSLSIEDLRDNIRLQKLIEAMLSDQVQVTDEEITQYIENNRDFLPEDATEEELREQAVSRLEQQKLSEQYQQFMQGLREKANIQYFVDYGQQNQPAE